MTMQLILAPLIYVLAFVVVVICVQAVAGLVFSAGERNRRVNRRLTMRESGMTGEEVYAALVRKPQVGVRSAFLRGLNDSVWRYSNQAGVQLTPIRLLAIVAAVAGGLWLASLMLFRPGSGLEFIVNGTASLIGACAVSAAAVGFWLSSKRKARLKKLEEQLPLALDIITRAIRSGHPVVSAVQLAANELGDPVGSEFGLIIDETTYGFEFKRALLNFARRTGSPDAHFFAVSVAIQSETGGNLAEILGNLASVIRARTTLGKRVKALSSEGRMSANILSVLPALVVAVFLLVQPTLYTDKFSDPAFWPIVAFVLLLYGAGWVMIYRITHFKY